tara:strand:+ start:8231 stop:8464 length:234 start_codon:yes stop_codon:yes gene_type:complete
MMKHISIGYRRICGTPVPESGQYVTDAEWRKLPECPTCYANYQPTLATPEPKVDKDPVPQKPVRRGLYLRDYLEEIQ